MTYTYQISITPNGNHFCAVVRESEIRSLEFYRRTEPEVRLAVRQWLCTQALRHPLTSRQLPKLKSTTPDMQ